MMERRFEVEKGSQEKNYLEKTKGNSISSIHRVINFRLNCTFSSYLLLIVRFCTPSFFLSDFAPHPFAPLSDFAPHLCVQLHFSPLSFANCAILHPLFFFLSDFAPHLLSVFPSFKDDFEQNTIGKRWDAKSLKKKRGGCKIAQLAKDRGKSAIKP